MIRPQQLAAVSCASGQGGGPVASERRGCSDESVQVDAATGIFEIQPFSLVNEFGLVNNSGRD